jgi:hypothetical protein
VEERPGHAYSLGAWRRQGEFGESVVAALRAAGLKLTPSCRNMARANTS